MTIWVDADACPNGIKSILFRAADRAGVSLVLVANQRLTVPRSRNIRAVQVEAGFDVADRYIEDRTEPGDLVITADIPLADGVITRGGAVLTPRGEVLTAETIKLRLRQRNLAEQARDAGDFRGGPPPLSARDKQAFANGLDRWLAQRKNR